MCINRQRRNMRSQGNSNLHNGIRALCGENEEVKACAESKEEMKKLCKIRHWEKWRSWKISCAMANGWRNETWQVLACRAKMRDGNLQAKSKCCSLKRQATVAYRQHMKNKHHGKCLYSQAMNFCRDHAWMCWWTMKKLQCEMVAQVVLEIMR